MAYPQKQAENHHSTCFETFEKEGRLQIKSFKNQMDLFSHLYIRYKNRDGNIEEFFWFENQTYPSALSDSIGIQLGVKIDLLTCLEDHSQHKLLVSWLAAPSDGVIITKILKPATTKSFSNYDQLVFVSYILTKIHQGTWLDLVWKHRNKDSLKVTAKASREKSWEV